MVELDAVVHALLLFGRLRGRRGVIFSPQALLAKRCSGGCRLLLQRRESPNFRSLAAPGLRNSIVEEEACELCPIRQHNTRGNAMLAHGACVRGRTTAAPSRNSIGGGGGRRGTGPRLEDLVPLINVHHMSTSSPIFPPSFATM